MPDRSPLSATQTKVLAYLVKFLEMNDQLPTTANIATAFGWASSNAADTHLKAMEKKGYLVRNELHHLMLADRPGLQPQASTTHQTREQLLVMAKLLAEAINVVRNVEAEGCDEGEQLQSLIERSDAALARAALEHGMVWMGIDPGAGETTAYWVPELGAFA